MQQLISLLVRLLGPRYRLSPHVAAFLARAAHLGKNAQIPTELVPLAALLWARGWFNRQFLDTHRAWVLPYWATRQLDPTDRGFVGRALQPVLLNTAYRTWTMLGNPDSGLEAIVDPRGLITPQPTASAWSLDAWLRVDGETFFPSRLPDTAVTQSLYENLPLVQTLYEPARLRVRQQAFAMQDDAGGDWLVAAYQVENPRGETRRATLYLAPRPLNPEGAAVVDAIEWRTDAAVMQLWVNKELGAVMPMPNALGLSDEANGDVALHLDALNNWMELSDPTGLVTGAAAYELELRPHTHRIVTAVMPMSATREADAIPVQWIQPDTLPELKRSFQEKWRALLAQGMTIRVPDDVVQNAFEANKAFLLLFHDGNSITPGPFLYHHFWFRDAAFLLNALGQLGYHAQVKEVLKTYPRYLRKDGYMQTQEGEWDSNGQALWTIEQYTRLSGDYEVLHDQYWDMLNAAHWIDATRQKTKQPGARTPEHGLLPAGMSAEHLGPNDYYFWDDWWGLAGLRAAVFAANFFQNAADRDKLKFAFDAFFQDVSTALETAAQRNQAQWMPAAPSRGADSAMVSNLVASYPLQLFPPDDPRILATLDELRRVAFVEGAFFHHVGHGGFGTYLALELAGSELYLGRREAWDALRFMLKHASPTWTWGETIHPLTRRGGHGDGHHGWAAAELVSLMRCTLLYERGKTLVLTPLLPDEWVFETASIKVERAATYFGEVEFTLAFGERSATLVLKGKWRELPAEIEWHLPIPLKDAGGDKAGVTLLDEHRVLVPNHVTRVVATW